VDRVPVGVALVAGERDEVTGAQCGRFAGDVEDQLTALAIEILVGACAMGASGESSAAGQGDAIDFHARNGVRQELLDDRGPATFDRDVGSAKHL